ncbi:MAG: FecR domain-containing protein [Pseudomonadota bacterium]
MPETDPERARIVEEASDIFVRLQNDPENESLIRKRAEFLARGEAEREAWAYLLKAWKGTARKRRPKPPLIVALLGIVAAAAYFLSEPLYVAALADHSTRYEKSRVALASGDTADLDAATAIIDETQGAERRVKLLRGAAFFDVETDGRPFLVEAGDVIITVTGTAFEAARIDEAVLVSVAKGSVDVSFDGRTWNLDEGSHLIWSPDEDAAVNLIDPQDVASWRADRFTANGIPFRQVAAIIDRRLPGEVVVLDETLARSEIAGTIDLRDPMLALRTLAAARSASLVAAPPLITVIYPD